MIISKITSNEEKRGGRIYIKLTTILSNYLKTERGASLVDAPLYRSYTLAIIVKKILSLQSRHIREEVL